MEGGAEAYALHQTEDRRARRSHARSPLPSGPRAPLSCPTGFGDAGVPEPLLLQGRSVHEWAQIPQLRPIPPPEPEWSPALGEFCELFFEDGWWKVRVSAHNEDGLGGWTVLYAPAQAVHTVPRERLRPVFTWDVEEQKFAPIKMSGRAIRP